MTPLIGADYGPKGRKKLWNDALEESSKELKCMISEETLLNYTDWKILLTVNTDASDKHLGDVIIQNNKPIYFSHEN